MSGPDRWEGYVARFHDDRPGITEDLLGRTDDDGIDPYAWCVEPLEGRPGPVLDLAAGSGPIAAALARGAPGAGVDPHPVDDRAGRGAMPRRGPGSGWIGVDTSTGELDRARRARRGPLVRGSATAVPVPDGAVAAVACAMGLQVVDPLEGALVELGRILAPGGRAVLLLPAAWPLGARDVWTYARLQVALRATIRYPNGPALSRRRLPGRVRPHGLEVRRDEARAFSLSVDDEAATLLVRSLYLPGTDADRRAAAVAVVAARAGPRLAIPLRRVVLDRT